MNPTTSKFFFNAYASLQLIYRNRKIVYKGTRFIHAYAFFRVTLEVSLSNDQETFNSILPSKQFKRHNKEIIKHNVRPERKGRHKDAMLMVVVNINLFVTSLILIIAPNLYSNFGFQPCHIIMLIIKLR